MKSSESGPLPVKLAVSLAAVGALGPSAVDMYLSSVPKIARDLGASFTSVQLTLTVFLFAMGAGQLLFGPMVDAYGRRRPLLAGLMLFAGCSFGAACAGDLQTLLAFRFVQGLGSALTLIVVMSMVRDVSDGVNATKLFALLMTIEGIAPIMAPTLGGFIDGHFGWRVVMLTIGVMGLGALCNSGFNLPETLPVSKREPLRLLQVFANYLSIARDPRFLRPALTMSGTFFFLFAYIGGVPLVYQETYGLSPEVFGVLFGATGIAVLLGAMSTGRLVNRLGLNRLTLYGVSFMAIGAAITLLSVLTGLGLPGIAAGMAIALFGMGIAETTLMSIVMSSQEKSLGSTAALLGAIQLSLSSSATPISAMTLGYGTLPWTAMLTASALVVLALAVTCVRANPQPSVTAGGVHGL